MKAIQHNIKTLREHTGLTAVKFAAVFNTTKSNIESYEQGRASPGAELSNRICIYFNITIEQLFNQKITSEDLKITGRIQSIAEVKLEAANEKNKLLEQTIRDLREIIRLQNGSGKKSGKKQG